MSADPFDIQFFEGTANLSRRQFRAIFAGQ
jgi:hypothetical protein